MPTEQKVIHGDNIEVLKGMEDNSVDSCVSDPPYGLQFMQKKWDYEVPSVELWKEVMRVLKPGGHLLAACGTRTQHRMAVNIEDAGFEIRDVITWHYGNGFPKSLSISKQLDKEAGVDREVIGKSKAGKNSKAFHLREQYDGTDQFLTGGEYDITAPATEQAKEWNGWGTALKPATEFWTLARKPIIEKTVAANVLKHGTGGINIDACRIGVDVIETNGGEKFKGEGIYNKYDKDFAGNTHVGRFPANLILGCNCETEEHEEGCPVKELDRQSGIKTSGKVKPEGFKGEYTANVYGKFANNVINPETVYGDTGYASRFFYIAKPTEWEKERGLRNFDLKDPACVTDFRPSLKSNPENWSNGTETPYMRTTQRKNTHATVKPISLMRYLVRMITPKQVLVCENCINVNYEKRKKTTSSTSNLSSMSSDIQAEGQQTLGSVLFGGVYEQMESPNEGKAMQGVQKEFSSCSDGQEGADFLLQRVRLQVEGKDKEEQQENAKSEGVYNHLQAGASFSKQEGNGFGTQNENDEAFKTNAATNGNSPSQKPNKNRQSNKEFGSDGKEQTRPITETEGRANKMSSLSQNDKGVRTCPTCGGNLIEKAGICIDPFGGSGTTMIACKLEGVNGIMIEQNEYDCEIAKARIAAWQNIEQEKLF